MEALSLSGIDGEPRSIPADAFSTFSSDLAGSVLRPDDAGYAEAIALWNGMITKRPAIVVRASGTDDVVRTVNFARDNGVELSIKGAGHNIAGLALTDGGITLDMSGFKGVQAKVTLSVAQTARLDFKMEVGNIEETIDVVVGERPGGEGAGFLGIATEEIPDVPFEVVFNLADIGGPSAGLMFSLALVDKLSPGEINGGLNVAGTGTIDSDGIVSTTVSRDRSTIEKAPLS